ncbi:MAG: VWA domain-containing protein, partial [Methanomicrobiales archaeon]|nr:VWA domain-containing protein [Methanomicrobiales archaeon]
FFLTYILTDGFGNPSGNTTVVISTSLGESYSTRTNSDGQIMISYGPRDSTGVITVTARSAVNASVITHQNLEFVSTAPTDMLLTASPQVMPSHDVDAALTAAIRAKVMDTKGNPVDNETVTFQIVNIINDSAQTSPPVLLATSALTNQNGYAIVEFVPGTFETDWQAANFDETATATCDVVAIWNATSRTLPLEWKNFPYLSVETEVFPETVAVNDTVDVTIRLIGNGWALQPDPIDVMLCMDRSGSMLQNNPDRMVQTISAAKIFNAQMSPARDQVGLVSFGNWGWTDIFSYSYRYWAGSDSTYYDDASYIAANYPGNPKNYGGYATLDLPLSYDHAVVEAAIEGLVPYGGTPMRYGLYEAGKELIANSNPKAVKAAILLSDGDWNTGGDPKGGYGAVSLTDIGTGSVITWMANNNIKIYTIRLGSSGNEADLTSYAAETGGRYYYAPSGDDLAAIYTEIAGDLKTEASVDTEMDIAFTGIEVNNATYAGDAADVVRYVYLNGASTTIESWNFTHTITPRYTIDQTADWNAGRSLNFGVDDIGTIRLNQTWETHFLLRMMQGGNINIFGPGSVISFDGGNSTLSLPDTFITAVPNLTAAGVNFTTLQIEHFASPNRDNVTDTLQLTWELNYSGQFPVTQLLRYQRQGDPSFVQFRKLTATPPFASPLPQSTTLDIRKLNPGEYRIWIIARAADAPDDTRYLDGWITFGTAGGAYIRIQ